MHGTWIYCHRGIKEGGAYVITIEKDPNVIELARINPWSRELFTGGKIQVIQGDAFEVVKKFKQASFDVVIHDPPRASHWQAISIQRSSTGSFSGFLSLEGDYSTTSATRGGRSTGKKTSRGGESWKG